MAVEPAAAGAARTVFLTGPPAVHRGEVLLLAADVTLYGSRNPADHQIHGTSACGTLSGPDDGCSPLITVLGAWSRCVRPPAARAASTAAAT
ncbi:hypothetical protein GXW83_17660 [Streptacidiphilus sp. PB12-B1b]|uniref:hypothetical protein n=1 Tax=Streptacidiphilus sp. PB12-B1b TaxID=2705012 RepID=UPI0015FC0217|nr:hypothetical protein [Streptacidiphilus sp. PB12-B1b]QMU77248.1 hypothetical protein GXW83_17605 [Streptacidiphilus sp. PB12-B1b]QMU77256.1 hypothetical protein GXW83_17660 [Streptacidiphilus sp. PB12-B1b]